MNRRGQRPHARSREPSHHNSPNPRIAFFGHFGRGNLGNDSSLVAMLCGLRRATPNAEFTCVCTGPEVVETDYKISAVAGRAMLLARWTPQGLLGRRVRRLLVGAVGEPYQWLRSIKILMGMDALIVPGTGILQDTDTFLGWGPYDLFRWSLAARLSRCRLLFVSMGAGPVCGGMGRLLIKTALSLAHYRSYRDEATRRCLRDFWAPAGADPLYPDLVFSLPISPPSYDIRRDSLRPTVGLGLMIESGRYSTTNPSDDTYPTYLGALAEFARWLLGHGYDIRLLVGDSVDAPVLDEFDSLLADGRIRFEEGRIINQPIESINDLLAALSGTDLVVATRFHNVVLSLLLGKPVISISFHSKCTALMDAMGLSEYCQRIDLLDSESLVERFQKLQSNAESVRAAALERAATFRGALDEQYLVIDDVISGKRTHTGGSIMSWLSPG